MPVWKEQKDGKRYKKRVCEDAAAENMTMNIFFLTQNFNKFSIQIEFLYKILFP